MTEQNDELQAISEDNSDAQNKAALEKRISELEQANSTLRKEKSQIETNYATVQANYDAALAEIEEKDATIVRLTAQIQDEKSSNSSDSPMPVNWIKKLPPSVNNWSEVYDGSDHAKYFSVAGSHQTEGIHLRTYDGYVVAKQNAYVIWYTNGQYNTMTFTICSTAEENATLEVYVNGDYRTNYDLNWDDPPKTITIDLNHAENVKINIPNNTYTKDISYGIYNVTFVD